MPSLIHLGNQSLGQSGGPSFLARPEVICPCSLSFSPWHQTNLRIFSLPGLFKEGCRDEWVLGSNKDGKSDTLANMKPQSNHAGISRHPWDPVAGTLWLLVAVFFLLGLLVLLRHEMWQDEWQAWLLAPGIPK